MRRQDMTKEAAEEILGLPPRYNKEELRKAYTDMARRYHPDAAAQHHFDPAEAQRRMVEANKAYKVLKVQFRGMEGRVIERGSGGIARGFADVDWKSGLDDLSYGDDPWSFVEDWGAEAAPQPVPLSVRSVLLGPVVLRVVFVALFAWVWWNVFPLLPHNYGSYVPAREWTLLGVARLVAAMVYPTYLVVYEAIAGYASEFVREVLNGAVSWVLRRYVDLRPRSASYGCALYKLLRNQVYALLMLPLVLYLFALAFEQDLLLLKIPIGAVGLVLAIDMLAACAHGGYVNVWSTALSERVEAWYLLIRARLLKRCGQWDDRRA
ncbi:MAG: DnaJ domain-containing protein [Coriobacteriales bacterium]|nr:DnaJ domain-containing protein [Coriobacteriales bacterium]